jgi:hypothetical protein
MMREIEIPQSEHGNPVRRWFQGDHVEMVIWENPDGDILKIRVTSRGKHPEETLTWVSSLGHICHEHFEENPSRSNWVSDSITGSYELFNYFKNEASTLPEMIRSFVLDKLNPEIRTQLLVHFPPAESR